MADQATTTAVSPCGAPGGGTAGEGGAAGGAQGMMGMLFPLAIFVLIFYFFIIRPQRKRQKQHDNLISSIGRGDQIVTIGGFFGTVREVRDDTFLVELAEGVKVRILKSAVQTKRVVSASAPAAEEKKDQ
ncbi:MAG: preprotein translocase subunit YajC [Fretibacterium sp.]|uniref:preprotein translocase subunit YajC n=1 Tax=Fretibacterium sp. OH1220_COT-178 TaxID=2491047 RepID=UPI001F3C02A2|nr:preprotein translocase subunit YajC [Fretibacterium sp. OH1220_COT-178]MDO4785670.1 preprotein translocase subunit YajC [Fretibacterium sp.]